MHFPRAILPEVKLNELDRALRRKNGRSKKLYELQRTEKEQYINDYNSLLLLIWFVDINFGFYLEM
jgi:hypothetical protein